MVNLVEIAKGISIFIGFYIVAIILNYIVKPIIDAFTSIFASSDVSGAIFVGLMFLWTAGILVLPNVYIYKGVTEPSDLATPLQVLIAITVFLFGLMLSVKGWFFIEGLANISSNAFVTLLYWLGIGLMWFEIVLGIPVYIIWRAMER